MRDKKKRREYEKDLRERIREEQMTDEQVNQEIADFLKRLKTKSLIPTTNTAKKQQIRNNLRNNLKMSIKLNKNIGNTEFYLGCTIAQVKQHIEAQFEKGMNWDNWGYHGWHLDHIKPFFLFDLDKEEHRKEVCHYTNLKPLWYKQHRLKTRIEKHKMKDTIINPRYIKEEHD